MKYELYPLDNGKQLENFKPGSDTIQTKFYNDATVKWKNWVKASRAVIRLVQER